MSQYITNHDHYKHTDTETYEMHLYDYDMSSVSSSAASPKNSRIYILRACIASVWFILCMRICWISLCQKEPSRITPCMNVQRADIVDRNGLLIVTDMPVFGVYAHPVYITDPQKTAKLLYSVLPNISVGKLIKILNRSKPFVWIARKISPECKKKIEALAIKGIGFIPEKKRRYLHNRLFAHVLGYTNIDHRGLSGVEKYCDKRLIENPEPVHLSLDIRCQNILHSELAKSIESSGAKGGNAILIDMHSGEILAMTSLPDFSPSETGLSSSENIFDRNVMGRYEFGSIIKILTVAMALEEKIATLSSVYDATHPVRIGRFQITDFRGKKCPLSVREGFLYSSNIVHAKIALDAGPNKLLSFFHKTGLFSPVGIQTTGIAETRIPQKWSLAQMITASYGYGFAVSPLQMIQAIKTIITGFHVPLTLLCGTNQGSVSTKRIISQSTSQKMIALMREAVHNGQAVKARAHTCEIGAKTGTANICMNGRYLKGQNLTSCVAIFPIEKPKYILLVSLDRPKASAESHFFATAGWFAAPIASRIVDGISPLLGLIHIEPKTEDSIQCALDAAYQE